MRFYCPQFSIPSQFISVAVVLLYTTSLLIRQAQSIGCFVCSSINHNNPDCEDVFNATKKYYHKDCMSGRKLRNGLFPATNCIKVKAEINPGEEMIIRQCVVDGGGINSESEIGRSDHCNFINTIKFNGQYMTGCLLSCNTNGCNVADRKTYHMGTLIVTLLLTILALVK